MRKLTRICKGRFIISTSPVGLHDHARGILNNGIYGCVKHDVLWSRLVSPDLMDTYPIILVSSIFSASALHEQAEA